jgi:hypothetical protein
MISSVVVASGAFLRVTSAVLWIVREQKRLRQRSGTSGRAWRETIISRTLVTLRSTKKTAAVC